MGAILKFAVTATVSGIDIATVGTILIVLGIVGLLISIFYLLSADRRGVVVAAPRERIVERDPYADPYVDPRL